MAKKKVNDKLEDTTELVADQATIEGESGEVGLLDQNSGTIEEMEGELGEGEQIEPTDEPQEKNAWLALTPEDGKVDMMFCSAALGIPTGAVETRLAKLNHHEVLQVIEARKTANHQMVRAQFANAANRTNKPKIEKGKQPQQ